MKRCPVILLGLMALSCAVVGCKTSPQKQDADSLANDSVDSLAAAQDTMVTDSFGYVYYNADSTVHSTISVDYPRGDDSLSQAVRTFIAKQLLELYVPYNNEDLDSASLKTYPRYKGSLCKAQKMIDFYGKGAAKFLKAQRKEYQGDDNPGFCSEVNIRKTAETATYVTYAMNGYYEGGGAHGSYTWYSINISKLTLKPILKAIDSSKTRALQKILQNGVAQYFEGEEDFNLSSVYEYLDPMGEKGGKNLIPLPAYTPYIEGDSLCFVYQQYEIAPYSEGLVSFDVALKDIKPYLRKEVKDLIVDK